MIPVCSNILLLTNDLFLMGGLHDGLTNGRFTYVLCPSSPQYFKGENQLVIALILWECFTNYLTIAMLD